MERRMGAKKAGVWRRSGRSPYWKFRLRDERLGSESREAQHGHGAFHS